MTNAKDAEIARLRAELAEVKRLREAIQEDAGTMPIITLRDALAEHDCDSVDRRDALDYLDRLDAARTEVG